MADISYPKDLLPRPEQSGYSRDRSSGLISSQPESGPLYTQRVSFDNPSQFTLRWVMDRDDAAIFDQWWRDKLDDANKPFNIELYNEAGMVEQEAKFMPDGKPQLARVNADTFYYEASVFVRKTVNPYDGQYDFMTEFAALSPNNDWLAGASLLNEILNVTWPEG